MINVSEEFRQLMRERTDFAAYAQIELADGRALTVTDDAFAAGGVTLSDGAGASGLPLGAAICRTAQLEIVNGDGWLDEYDFFGAKIHLWLTFALSASEERIDLGTFTVTEPETRGETVSITAADDMIRADKPYAPGVAGEISLGQLWRDVCAQCGLAFSGGAFSNSDMTVTVPEEECTCRQMLGYTAMLAGGNARVDRQGSVQLLVYERGKAAEHELTDWASLSTDTDDVVITGVEIETDEGKVLEGQEGYVLTVENPLAAGREAEAMRRLGDVVIGLTLRRFAGEHVGYPLAEFMDTVRLADRRGRWYSSVITDVQFVCGRCTSLSNSAEGVVRNGSRYVSAETRARQAAKRLVQQERSARQAIEEQLRRQLADASGFYTTDVVQPDRSVIRYAHDKPTLEASKNVIKVTSEAIGFSTDGGKSYPFGVTVDGKTIMDIVAANGVLADWVETGILQSQPDASGKRGFVFDLNTGKAEVENLTIQGKSVQKIAEDEINGLTPQEMVDLLTDGGRLQGIFYRDGMLYINAAYLRGETIDLNVLKLVGTLCGLLQGHGVNSAGQTTTGIVIFGNGVDASGNANPPFIIVTNSGIRIQDTANTCAYLSGGAFTLESAFRPYKGKSWMYLDWVQVTGTDGNAYWALAGFNSPR